MKRTAILLLLAVNALLMHAGMSNSIEYGQLYIVGDATATSWDLGSAAELPRIDNGVFEWTGRLEGGKEFKFMNTREAWHKHIVAVGGNTVAEIGEDYPLNFFANWALDGSLDCKFKVAETGNYTVTVDLTSMRLVISEPKETAAWPDKFYLVGSATDNQVIEIPSCYGVEHKKTVSLHAGFVKLIDTPVITDKTRYFVPRFPEVDITYGQGCKVNLFASDDPEANGWSVTVPGDYKIYLDTYGQTYSCVKFRPYTVLYLVGGCCERQWNYWDDSNNCFVPDPARPEILVWEGELRIGWDKTSNSDGTLSEPAEPDKFKILTAQDWFRDTFHPYVADAPADGTSDARISGGDDLKWTIARDGYYRLELDTRTETLRSTCLSMMAASGAAPTDTSAIDEIATDEISADETYYNLQGIRIDNPVSGGIYIVKYGKGVTKRLIQ